MPVAEWLGDVDGERLRASAKLRVTPNRDYQACARPERGAEKSNEIYQACRMADESGDGKQRKYGAEDGNSDSDLPS